MLTPVEARELATRYRNLANRTGTTARRKSLLQNIARSYSALAGQLEMLEEAKSFTNDASGDRPTS